MSELELVDWEYQILREIIGELPMSPWGAAVGVALEYLYESGYIKTLFATKDSLTEKGLQYLKDRKENVSP